MTLTFNESQQHLPLYKFIICLFCTYLNEPFFRVVFFYLFSISNALLFLGLFEGIVVTVDLEGCEPCSMLVIPGS